MFFQQTLGMAPVAGGILDAGDDAGECLFQPSNQLDRQCHHGHGRDVVDENVASALADLFEHRREPGKQAVIADILEIGGRGEKNIAGAGLQGLGRLVAGVLDGIHQNAGDQTGRRNARLDEAGENDLPFTAADGASFARGAEECHAVAAIFKAASGMGDHGVDIDRSVLFERSGQGCRKAKFLGQVRCSSKVIAH